MAWPNPQRDKPQQYAAASPQPLGMWRYRDLLPPVTPLTTGEGWTPLLQSKRYAGLYLKQETANPTGSSEARGLAMLAALAANESPLDAAASERHRIDGVKTLGYELAEQLEWQYPKAIVFARSGVTMKALLQAFDEMEAQGWMEQGSGRPRLIAVDPQSLSEQQMLAAILNAARHEGVLLSPDSAAALVEYERRLSTADLKPQDRVVLIDSNAGAVDRVRPRTLPTSLPVGGIITPV